MKRKQGFFLISAPHLVPWRRLDPYSHHPLCFPSPGGLAQHHAPLAPCSLLLYLPPSLPPSPLSRPPHRGPVVRPRLRLPVG